MNSQLSPNSDSEFKTKASQILKHILNLRPIGGRPKDIQLSEDDLTHIREVLNYPVDGGWDFLTDQELEQRIENQKEH